MIRYIPLTLFFLFLACAADLRDRAIQGGVVAKEVVDSGAVVMKEVVDVKAEECAKHAGDRAKLDECLGPVVSNPDAIDAAFEGVRTAQLALFIALSDGSDDAEIKKALEELWGAVREVTALIKAAKGD